ncbi:MAG: PKD domain-containing protein [Thermoplasmatota archaeon]
MKSCLIVFGFALLCALPPAQAMASAHRDGGEEVAGLLEWARGLRSLQGTADPDVPFSGTPYFLEHHPELFMEGFEDGGAAPAPRWNPQLKKTGAHCRIYIDVDSVSPVPNDTTLQSLADEFDTVVWPNDTAVFGAAGYSVIDLFIYYMDGQGGLGGYYSGGNDLYIDSADRPHWYEIIAHEFQHCIHRTRDSDEELWVNEGCSDLGIEVCYGTNASYLRSHINSFESSPNNDLTSFSSAGHDYGSAYAFLSYFSEHYGGRQTIYALVGDAANGIAGFSNRLAGTGKDFNRVFREWTVANYMDNATIAPVYGYANLSIRVAATRVRSFPYEARGTVSRWAATYFEFEAAGADLVLNFDGADGAPLELYVGAVGLEGSPSMVEKVSLDEFTDGGFTVPGLGINYSTAVMVVSSGPLRADFSFNASAVDRYPPVTSINITPPVPHCPDGWYTSPPTIILRASEEGSSTFYSWDSGPLRDYSSPLKALEGEHTLHFRSRDPAGNMEAERSVTLRVDTTPPVTELRADPPSPDGRGGWYVTAPRIDLAAEEGALTFFAWDRAPDEVLPGPLRAPEGRHTLRFYSVDAHGNRELDNAADFAVDTIQPSSTILFDPRTPNGLNGWYTRPPTIRLDTETGAELFYAWDGGAESRYSLPFQAREGRHELAHWAVDGAGNAEERHIVEVKLDTAAPISRATVTPPEPDGEGGVYVSRVTVELATDSDARLLYRWSRGGYREYSGPLTAPEGKSTLSFYAVDEAGNVGSEVSLDFAVDLTPPVTTLLVDPDFDALWTSEAPAVVLLTEPGARAYYRLDDGPLKPFLSGVRIPSGVHALAYHSVDAAGNREPERTRVFRVDLHDPTAVLNASRTSALVGERVTLDASASIDEESGVLGYEFSFGDGASSGWVGGPRGPFKEHIYYQAGSYTVTLRVVDASGRESAPATLTITVQEPEPAPSEAVVGPEPPLLQRALSHPLFPLALFAGLALLALVVSAAALTIASGRRRSGGDSGEGPPPGLAGAAPACPADPLQRGPPTPWAGAGPQIADRAGPPVQEPPGAPPGASAGGGESVHGEIRDILKRLEELDR